MELHRYLDSILIFMIFILMFVWKLYILNYVKNTRRVQIKILELLLEIKKQKKCNLPRLEDAANLDEAMRAIDPVYDTHIKLRRKGRKF